MKANLTHLASKKSWNSKEAPSGRTEVLKLEGQDGPYELLIEREGDLADPFAVLTERQREVAKLAASGMTTQGIADELNVGNETVRTHIKTDYLKLGVESRAELARVAVGDLVLPPEE